VVKGRFVYRIRMTIADDLEEIAAPGTVTRRKALGEQAFARLLREYCRRFRRKRAGRWDLIPLAAQTCRCPLSGLASAWGAGP
jgi:hypothetical protein